MPKKNPKSSFSVGQSFGNTLSLNTTPIIKRSPSNITNADLPALKLPPSSSEKALPVATLQKNKTQVPRWPFAVGIIICFAVVIFVIVFLIVHFLFGHNNEVPSPVPSPEPGLPSTMASPEPQITETPAPLSTFNDIADFVPNNRGGMIPINYCLPDNPDGAPLVVMCHGFCGNRDGNGHFAPLAQDLASAGIASVRLDFPGHGDNKESSTSYTLHNIASDITSVIRWMEDKHIDTTNIAMVGHSMGGRIVTYYVQPDDSPNATNDYYASVKGIALWSPANGDGLQGLEFLDIDNIDNVYALRESARGGSVIIPKWSLELSNELFDEIENNYPSNTLQNYSGRILLFYTTNENVVFSENTVNSVIEAVNANPNGEVVSPAKFSMAHHNYTALDPEQGPALDPIIDKSLRSYTMGHLLLPVLKGESSSSSVALPSPSPNSDESAPSDTFVPNGSAFDSDSSSDVVSDTTEQGSTQAASPDTPPINEDALDPTIFPAA